MRRREPGTLGVGSVDDRENLVEARYREVARDAVDAREQRPRGRRRPCISGQALPLLPLSIRNSQMPSARRTIPYR
mgnify:CR=1 FL=1